MSAQHPLEPWPFKPPPRGEDLPYDDGEPMESERHVKQMTLLIESLSLAWEERQDFYVGGNMFVYFSETQAKRNDFRGPDVFVVLDTVKRERKSWVVWEENGRTPDLVIELISPKTEKVDRGEKMDIYARLLRVGEYVLWDPWTFVLEGYELDHRTSSYRRVELDERGWFQSRKLGLFLGPVRSTYIGLELDWLRWVDPAGRMLPHLGERAEAESQRAEAESQRAEAESQRAEAESQRADAAERRLEEERQRIAALEAELERLRRG